MLSEWDFAIVKAVDDGEAMHVVACLAELVAAALKTFLDDESHAGSLTVRGEIFLKIIGLQFGKVNFLFVSL